MCKKRKKNKAKRRKKRLTCVLFLCEIIVVEGMWIVLKNGRTTSNSKSNKEEYFVFFCRYEQKERTPYWPIEVHSNLFTQIEYAHL